MHWERLVWSSEEQLHGLYMLYRIAGNFRWWKISSRLFRRNFRRFYFHGTNVWCSNHTPTICPTCELKKRHWTMKRRSLCYNGLLNRNIQHHWSQLQSTFFHSLYFCGSRSVHKNKKKICTQQKFPTIRYLFECYSWISLFSPFIVSISSSYF